MLTKGQYEQVGESYFREVSNVYGKYKNDACVTEAQICCIMGLIIGYHFKDGSEVLRTAETGVNIGMTDYFMLHAGVQKSQGFTLFGIDIASEDWVGEVIKKEATPDEKRAWRDCTGKTVFDIENFWDSGKPLDLVFIDGAHAHPYPLLDLLFFYPYMRKDGIVVLHDVENYVQFGELGGCYLYTGWQKEKYLNWTLDGKHTESMGIIELPGNVDEVLEWILRVARQPITAPSFYYSSDENRGMGDFLGISDASLAIVRGFVKKHYKEDFAEEFLGIFEKSIAEYRSEEIYKFHEQRLNDYYRMEINKLWKVLSDVGFSMEYKAPSNFLPRGTHIALYGAGKVGRAFLGQYLRKGTYVVDMVIDRNAKTINRSSFTTFFDILVYTPGEVVKFLGSRPVLIGVEKESMAKSIRDSLLELGVSADQVYWFNPFSVEKFENP